MPVETEIKFRLDTLADVAGLTQRLKAPASRCKPRAPSRATFSTTRPTARCAPAPRFCAYAVMPAADGHPQAPAGRWSRRRTPTSTASKPRPKSPTAMRWPKFFSRSASFPPSATRNGVPSGPMAKAIASSMKLQSATTPSWKAPPSGSTEPQRASASTPPNTSHSATAASFELWRGRAPLHRPRPHLRRRNNRLLAPSSSSFMAPAAYGAEPTVDFPPWFAANTHHARL